MITLTPDFFGDRLAWAQKQVAAHHYLQKRVDVRSRPFAYTVHLADQPYPIGCLIFGRPEASRCYDGNLRYGSQGDAAAGRADHDRWSVLNLARVWLDPETQPGGWMHRPHLLPGYTDRHGIWRSTLASTAIREALAVVGYDYLRLHSPVDCAYPYEITAVLSYCDTRLYKGTIYRAAGFTLARRNERGIETWFSTAVTPLSAGQDAEVRRLAERSPRSQRIRAGRQQTAQQPVLFGEGL